MNFLTAKWNNIIMANYEISPEVLQPYIPPGTMLDFYHGKTYVSLVGFMFSDTKIFGIPIPGLGNFEEINLRFYVCRKTAGQVKRGVVFINETVPFKLVAWMANKLYKEHYTSIPTRHNWVTNESTKHIDYGWKLNGIWNHLKILAANDSNPILRGSIEEFIFEHYWGYTGDDSRGTTEYEVYHPSWMVNKVASCSVSCDFASMYGKDFEILSNQKPDTVLLAEGSHISVKWKRTKIS
jgi:uncharacterized protein YqjF (DUF2071 family)